MTGEMIAAVSVTGENLLIHVLIFFFIGPGSALWYRRTRPR